MSRAFIFIISMLTLLPLISFPHPGGDALLIPFNIFLWEIAAAAVFFASLYIYQHRVLILPRQALWILALPVGLAVSGFISGLDRPVDWMFRLAAIIMGLLFFFALFQFQPGRRTQDNAIYIILAGMLINALISILQLVPGRPLLGLIPPSAQARAVGVFMQPNLLASAMATAVLLALYQLSSPGFGHRPLLLRIFCVLTLAVTGFVTLATGSRTGLLALAVALPILLLARKRLLLQHKTRTGLALAALLIGCTTGALASDGLLKAYSKLERLAEAGTDARPHLYRIAWDLYTDKPLAGHGIGSFQRVFHERAAEYLQAHGGEPLIGHVRFTHPHNELLFWAVEGGSLALLGILALLVATLLQLWRIGWQRGGALLAIALPITLHTQTELPFYSSIYHWLLFLLLAFLIFRPGQRPLRINGSSRLLIPVPAIGMAVLIATLMFCTTTFQASRDLNRFLLYKEINLEELRRAQDNTYFHEFATLLTLNVLLNQDLTQGTQRWTELYIRWMEDYLAQIPDISSFHNLALAYHHLGMQDKAMATIDRGLYLFPQHPVIASARDKILRGLRSSIASMPDATE